MNTATPRPLRIALTGLALFTILMIVPQLTFGQSDSGRLVGTLSDQNGGLVPGATVVVKNERTGEERVVTSTTEGTYTVSALKPSLYTVTASSQGLTVSAKNIQLLIGQELKLDLTLQPEGLEAKVNVVAGAEAVLSNDSASMNVNVNPREVEGLPLNGRQLSQLYLQAPGSVNSGSGTFGDIRFSGRAVNQNIVRYDGVEGSAIIDASPGNLNGEIAGPFRLQSSLENVQEFRVDSNNYPAEYGTGTGGQISVVTKSGSNKFHGSAFEYIRNDVLDAANFFDNIVGTKSPLRLNQFGGSLGGPLIKDKAFFFASYEGYRLRAGINSVEAVPGEQARICAVVTCNAVILPFLPAFRAPNATIISRGTDTNLFDVAQLQGTSTVNEDAYAFRFDYHVNKTNSMYFRFFRDDGDNTQPEGVTGRRVVSAVTPQNGVIALQTILSPTVLNELKFGYNGAKTRVNGQAPIVNGLDLSAITLNISGNTANFNLPGQGTSAGTAVPGGLVRANSATNGRGQPYTPYTLSVIDNVSWTSHAHNFRFGGELRAIRLYTDRLGGTTYTFSSLQSFLSNTLQSVQFVGDLSATSPFTGVSGQRLAKQEYYIAYGQDQWNVRPGLTLNLGLRYEYYTPLRENNNGQVLFDITRGVLRDPSESAFGSKRSNFGPRLALTWSPNVAGGGFFGGGKTVLRGGFGIFYGPGQTEDQIQPIESDRVSTTISGSTIVNGVQLLAFPAPTQSIIDNFVNNPTNRSYQPRAYAPEYVIPERVYQYSLSYQQELPYKIVATVGYVGSQGRNLFLRSVANQILPGQAIIGPTATSLPAGVGVVNITNAGGQVVAVRTVREFYIPNGVAAPLQPFAEVDFKTAGGKDTYNALQAQLSRRIGIGLTMNAQYTFGKSFGNTAGSNEARTAANNARALNEYDYDRSVNNFDVRHTFNLSAVYDLPIGRGKRFDLNGIGNAILGNWEVGTILNARSGLPIEVGIVRPDIVVHCQSAAGCPVSNAAGAAIVPQGFVAQLPTVSSAAPLPLGFAAVVNTPGGGASRNVRRPNLITGVNPYLNSDRNLLNPAAFAIPDPGTFGNLPRNALRGPNFSQVDFIFNRRFPLTETVRLEFRTEIFNVFNRTNFALPGSALNVGLPTLGSSGVQPGQGYSQSAAGSTFGLLRQTVERTVGLGTNRQIQFALRLNF
jgi:hypothetical protein